MVLGENQIQQEIFLAKKQISHFLKAQTSNKRLHPIKQGRPKCACFIANSTVNRVLCIMKQDIKYFNAKVF